MTTKLLNAVALLLMLAGCGGLGGNAVLSPYRIEVRQGNQVTQEMLAKLKPGMTSSQVRFVLGTPLIVDPFHKDRWDYAYRLKKDGDVVEQRHVAVFFEDDRLVRVVDSAAPTPQETVKP